MNPVIIRTDAGSQIGTGHLMRCLALAQALQDRGDRVIFAMSSPSPQIIEDLHQENMQVYPISEDVGTTADALNLIRIAVNANAKWIVIDGYNFGMGYQRTIKESGLSLLTIDDYGHAGNYLADIVLNQNIYADMALYPRHSAYTRFLLGSEYVLLRRQFRLYKSRSRLIPKVAKKILVTLGGGDPENITQVILLALNHIIDEDTKVIVVCGGVNPHYDILQEWVQDKPQFSLVHDAKNMPELMAWADLAISAGGSTCWELMFMGLPFLAVIMSDNQKPIVTRLDVMGATISLGISQSLQQLSLKNTLLDLILSEEKRKHISDKQALIIDCRGCQRVIDLLT